MGAVIVGSDAILAGTVTRAQLRWNYRSIYPDIYVPRAVQPTLSLRTKGAWLWTRRRGVITGRAAAAMHGAKWFGDDTPVEVLWSNNRPPPGIISRREPIAPGEVMWLKGVPVAKPARAGLDLGRHLPRGEAVAALDSLASATGVGTADILELALRYKGSRGVRRCRQAVELMDAGAQSPQETRVRLVLIDNGFPRPETQIPLLDDDGYTFAYLDMGWRNVKIAVEYDGQHHRTDDEQYRWDARRLHKIHAKGWTHIRVIKGDRPHEIQAWVRRAFELRESEAMAVNMPA